MAKKQTVGAAAAVPSRPSAAVLAAATADKYVPSADKLDTVRKVLREMRDREMQNAQLAATIKENSAWLQQQKSKDLVDLFEVTGIDRLGLPAEGNLPPYEIQIKDYYHANIQTDWPDEQRAAAYTYLREQKAGDLIKTTFMIAFGMGQEKAAKALGALLKKNKVQYSVTHGVPWNSLTAWLREQVVEHERMPKLELIGGTVGRVASVVAAKKEK